LKPGAFKLWVKTAFTLYSPASMVGLHTKSMKFVWFCATAPGVAMQVEGDSLLIGRHINHSAFSLADRYFSQSDEEEVGQ
jgi:hypothetical protein